MRSLRRSASPYDTFVDSLRPFLAKRLTECGGLILFTGAVALTVALATWSINDPSLNHATDQRAHNVLGRPGAVVADLAMQLLGLGSIALALPPALWGVRLMRERDLPHGGLRIVLWFVGVLCASAVASALPPTDRWPLPTGMGGVAGDALLAGTRMLVGPLAHFAGFLFAASAILSLTAACRVTKPDFEEDEEGPYGAARPAPRSGRASTHEERHDADEPSLGILSLGALAQAVMRGRASLRTRLESWQAPADEAEGLAYAGASPALAARRAFADSDEAPWAPQARERADVSGRREPQFDSEEDDSDEAPARAVAQRPAPSAAGAETTADEPPTRVSRPLPQAPAARPRPAEPRPEAGEYRLPALELLARPREAAPGSEVSAEALEQNATMLEATLQDFGVRGDILAVRPGPVVTLYELEPAPGTKSSRVIALADDIARSMSAVSARVAVVPGRNAIGIELPNAKRETVFLRELLASEDFVETKQKLALCLGKNIGGEPIIADLARMPHLLVAGTTGSGKSVAVNTMILSLLYRLKPEECRLIMVDPKMLELSVYDGIPHLLSPVVTDPKKAVIALKWAVREMEERYKKMSKVGVRNIDGFNARLEEARARGETLTRTVQTGFDRSTGEAVYEDEVMDLNPLPYIVIVVDEMADLMMVAGKDIEGAIQRLAQMARAAGIHLIMATQRPSVDVITGTIKANFPTRISFQVTSKIDSRTILGEMGAEQLLGQGDMLFMAGGGRTTRVHGPFCSDSEVETVVAHLKRQGRPSYLEAVTAEEGEIPAGGPASEDGPVFDAGQFGGGGEGGDLYEQAVAVVLRDKKASTSYIQRRLQIGYNRAASLMERMETEGLVGPANHAGKREILVEPEPQAY
ncbi:UNVERIFIED_ORG: S-DNA-T family DNA segregation ATPase FtsK/SpoIIIE [Methylobacterium sp. SuP10 SLI 274]|uniref:DNA translocase FtsK n=1 Tax=Methylorubrum extorquens TaxID=408 RepID=UPI00209F219F|nr:DNA translocase FtsK [Methylorubrum extorquens]MDF9865661.1 S-DNA-T family DNA segregation ATPase FtsK/SpoIIIE [Methylorubrum pseudosasae]MDH6639226.1 S-DNA-T family DNA segregation ATPase FtsK/SpoIIIE [Methylobacterium sp. SuP10 SLI 274]MDH6668416.1 S-DNA-T family DNA segregation ATPase FtsK/SpoIIIE [Methylorubrum zatmanii]MCP1560302.1 S-DNA-T family DNA segregation ATPase FtsK/SpoIIIE [Methylorubrum extorquens]MDF9793965.1 S-DNA-T family DNA segregation ATPase FtsK/SpoIIIE [Methylorubrum 